MAKDTKETKTKRKPSAAFMKPVQPDAVLAKVVGDKPLPRTELTKKLWVYIKKAGLQAAALAEALGEWEQAANIYGRLEKKLPQLSQLLENKITAAREHLPPKKN